jgi:predicted nucleotidyltransferase component of viral defense system
MEIDNWQTVDDDQLMLWIMHAFAKHFRQHAILKGGMELMLMSSERATNNLDYVFVPYKSKKEISPQIEQILRRIPDVEIDTSMHSNAGRYRVRVGKADIQIEYNVSQAMPSIELTTELLASKFNALPGIIRVMSPEVALAHKMGAWNERRLLRDLYDIYYVYTHMQVTPEMDVLKQRLNQVDSRLPRLRKIREMSMAEFVRELRSAVGVLTEQDLQQGLAPLMKTDRLRGLLPVLRAKLGELATLLEERASPS